MWKKARLFGPPWCCRWTKNITVYFLAVSMSESPLPIHRHARSFGRNRPKANHRNRAKIGRNLPGGRSCTQPRNPEPNPPFLPPRRPRSVAPEAAIGRDDQTSSAPIGPRGAEADGRAPPGRSGGKRRGSSIPSRSVERPSGAEWIFRVSRDPVVPSQMVIGDTAM